MTVGGRKQSKSIACLIQYIRQPLLDGVMKPRVSQWDTNYAFIISHHLKKSNGKIKPAVKDKAGLELVIAQ